MNTDQSGSFSFPIEDLFGPYTIAIVSGACAGILLLWGLGRVQDGRLLGGWIRIVLGAALLVGGYFPGSAA